MAEIWTQYGIGSIPQLITFAEQKIHELKEVIKRAENEIEMWEKLKIRLNPCRKCRGHGEVNVAHPDLSAEHCAIAKCLECKGTGESKTT